MLKNPLRLFNIAVFLQAQIFLLPVLLLFYQHNGLTTGDFFLFQGIFSIVGLLMELPAGYIGDLYSKKTVLAISYACFILRLLLWLFFAQYGYWIILIGEILYAAQKASFSGVSDGYVYEYLKSQDKQGRMLKRYGKLNFFMSAGTAISSLFGAYCYQTVSNWTLSCYQKDYGFIVLIIMELLLNVSAFILICFLPKLPPVERAQKSLKEVYIKFFHIIGWTLNNKSIRYHILLAGILAATTMVFVWSFQPMMKLLAIPVSVYGVVYFINHIFRALSSYELGTIMRYVSLARLSLITFVLFVFGFIFSFVIISLQPLPLYANLAYFLFLSFAIGSQLAFSLANISRIHQVVPSDIRATVSSFNTATGRLCAGVFLILLKFLIDGFSTQASLGICFAIFIFSLFPLRHVCRLSSQEQSPS